MSKLVSQLVKERRNGAVRKVIGSTTEPQPNQILFISTNYYLVLYDFFSHIRSQHGSFCPSRRSE